MRITILFLFVLVLGSACKNDECMIPCDFEGTVQIDTTWPIPDQKWLPGKDTVTFVYRDSLGMTDSMYWDVTDYSFSYTEREYISPCGECGDSILAKEVTPHFTYTIQSDRDLSMTITMNSGLVIEEDNRILQCVDGKIEFFKNNQSIREESFIWDCNSVFDLEDALEINNTYRGQNATQADSILICPITAGDFYFYQPSSTMKIFTLADDIPVRNFELEGQCWYFDTLIVR